MCQGGTPQQSNPNSFSAFGTPQSFGQAKSSATPMDYSSMGGAMGNFNPSGGYSTGLYTGSMGGSMGNFDPSAGYSTGLWNPSANQTPGQLNPLPSAGNSSYQPYMGAPDLSQFNLSQPYINRTVQEANSPDQQSLQGFNSANGTNYQSLTQIPADQWQNYQATSGQAQPGSGVGQTKGVVISENPFNRQGVQNATGGLPPGYQPGPNGGIQFSPPAYPTWMYGPTAGLFGGVSRPQGTPMNYGYFPGTGTWGVQPNGSNFS